MTPTIGLGPATKFPAALPANNYGGGSWQDDQYQDGTRDPKRDYEKAQRLQWLAAKMDDLQYKMKACGSRCGEIERKIADLGNQNYSLNTSRERMTYELGQLDTSLARAKGEQARIKEKLRDPYYKSEWGYLSTRRYQIADEISRLSDQRQRVYWDLNDVSSKLRYNQQEIEWAQKELSTKQSECYRYKYEYDVYAAEYNDLRY